MVTDVLSRRSVLKLGLGVAPFCALAEVGVADTVCKDRDAVYVSTAKSAGRHLAVFLDGDVQPVDLLPLPGRGHGAAVNRAGDSAVVFARRPGQYFNVYQLGHPVRQLITVPAVTGRHFYGHGCFSRSGRYLFATENDYDGGRGVIGCYDSHNGYQRVTEFYSGGVGPHELIAIPDTDLIVVANGGIQTHPDSGRRKLNLATMRSSIALIDSRDGSLVSNYYPADELQQLSLRHLAYCHHDQSVWYACQYQGNEDVPAELIGKIALDLSSDSRAQQLSNAGSAVRLPEELATKTLGYLSSVAASGRQIMFTSSRGGVMFSVDVARGELIESAPLIDCSGVSSMGCTEASDTAGFIVSSGAGNLLRTGRSHSATVNYPFQWDNHLYRLV